MGTKISAKTVPVRPDTTAGQTRLPTNGGRSSAAGPSAGRRK